MMPSGPRLALSVLVALAVMLGALLFVDPHNGKDGFTHSAQPGKHRVLQ